MAATARYRETLRAEWARLAALIGQRGDSTFLARALAQVEQEMARDAREQAEGQAGPFDVVLLGPPGSGKGTQGVLLSERRGIVHVSTGDMLRALDRGSELGAQVAALIDNGNFVPDELIAALLRERIELADCAFGVVFDGFPRNRSQLPIFDTLLTELRRGTATIVEIVCPIPLARERCLSRARASGRADDTEAVIERRLEVYFEETQSLVTECAASGRSLQVDGAGSVERVAAAVDEALAVARIGRNADVILA